MLRGVDLRKSSGRVNGVVLRVGPLADSALDEQKDALSVVQRGIYPEDVLDMSVLVSRPADEFGVVVKPTSIEERNPKQLLSTLVTQLYRPS